MRYCVFATDYDGTLATNGLVEDAAIAALERLKQADCRRILATGRELNVLLDNFPRLDLFDLVVLENGGVLYRPESREEWPLAGPMPALFVEELRRRGVGPISVGKTIVATWEPHEQVVREVIHDLKLNLHVLLNKRAIMILSIGVNKATGLRAALDVLGLLPQEVVGVGDAENDQAFLALCGYSVAVANALPMLKENADLVTVGGHGAGVVELIDRLLADDLAGPQTRRAGAG
ncbi:MAG: HAD family hydrolase [Isosphaeraceae bacterium]